jgi:hypothetical protein
MDSPGKNGPVLSVKTGGKVDGYLISMNTGNIIWLVVLTILKIFVDGKDYPIYYGK